jgi:hypothetical protein
VPGYGFPARHNRPEITPLTINIDIPSDILLAEIIIIEAFIQIIQMTDLSIGVGLAGTSSKFLY